MTDSRTRKLPGKYKMSFELLIALKSKKVLKKKKKKVKVIEASLNCSQ